jgi:hypothetical protein
MKAGRDIIPDDFHSTQPDNIIQAVEEDTRVPIEGIFSNRNDFRRAVGGVQIGKEKSNFISPPMMSLIVGCCAWGPSRSRWYSDSTRVGTKNVGKTVREVGILDKYPIDSVQCLIVTSGCFLTSGGT